MPCIDMRIKCLPGEALRGLQGVRCEVLTGCGHLGAPHARWGHIRCTKHHVHHDKELATHALLNWVKICCGATGRAQLAAREEVNLDVGGVVALQPPHERGCQAPCQVWVLHSVAHTCAHVHVSLKAHGISPACFLENDKIECIQVSLLA